MTIAGWWRRRTLHARLSLLVAGSVAASLVVLSVVAWVVVAGIQRQQVESQLNTDAAAIAARPAQWLASSAALPGPGGPAGGPGDDHHRHELGPRWQILDRTGAVVGAPANPLPVTDAALGVAAGSRRPAQERLRIGKDSYLMRTVPLPSGGAVQVAINQDPDNSVLAIFGLLLAAGCAIGIAGAAWLGRAVARAGLTPVQELTQAVENVAHTMDLNQPIPTHGTDEIARLAHSVNTMLTAIDTARRAQQTLVEDASHELRTPLTSIRTNIELLLQIQHHPELAHRLPPEDHTQLLTDLDHQVTELATLTTELVELAREETTREQPEPVDLPEIVHTAITRVRMRAPTLTYTADLRPTTITGRPGELERMVVNILDNAAKWSPANATVHTTLEAGDSGWTTLTISDSGPGITDADLPHIFDRFYRAPNARSMPGSGLGLAIVAHTATHHGGTVTASPNTPHGTTITVRLPTAPTPTGGSPG